jgi:hypothetical protein
MAARTIRVRHQDDIRNKIRASQLVNRLEDHVFGKVDLGQSQVTAALGLLKKCVPDKTENKTEIDVGESLASILKKLGKS